MNNTSIALKSMKTMNSMDYKIEPIIYPLEQNFTNTTNTTNNTPTARLTKTLSKTDNHSYTTTTTTYSTPTNDDSDDEKEDDEEYIPKNGGLSKGIIIGLASGLGVIGIVVCIFLVWYCNKINIVNTKSNNNNTNNTDINDNDIVIVQDP